MTQWLLFESYERRIDQDQFRAWLSTAFPALEECRDICKAKPASTPTTSSRASSPSAFENAAWAYTPGRRHRSEEERGHRCRRCRGHRRWACRPSASPALLPRTARWAWATAIWAPCCCGTRPSASAFLAGHESFAAAEGAIGIARTANKARKEPLRVILNGLGKDAAYIISRINGFTYVQTEFDYYTGELKIVREIRYSEGERADVRCYGADDVREGVAIMHHEGVDVSITGNSTNPTRFQHPVAGTYKKECIEQGKKYFSVASGGGTGRTLHPDNMAAGPASYGMTDTMGRMHSDAQFAGSSSVPAHVEMMGFLGMGNNPMVGATVAVAVAVAESKK